MSRGNTCDKPQVSELLPPAPGSRWLYPPSPSPDPRPAQTMPARCFAAALSDDPTPGSVTLSMLIFCGS